MYLVVLVRVLVMDKQMAVVGMIGAVKGSSNRGIVDRPVGLNHTYRAHS